ncbi:D-alanyl-D-alanine carboxypeptidase/D-alanyl-D-alanine-endopeptidase (penicillin-binding protein 4) [Streptacidiphilus sp. MAP12-16]|uniref:D-alanyl-D-alanine carboxypeptidase/D-alanyl-D-alanine endopeptidase n=1 Tax=Streptacidiphilus sp. MAP12-16 TaxID=3156300 RepID=UPI0035138F5E
MSSTSAGRHRKPKPSSVAVRRALVVAAAAPAAAAMLVGQGSAYAADKSVGVSAPDRAPDAADQQIAKNLDARVQDPRLLGSSLSGIVVDAQSGQEVWGHGATTTLMPASNMKIATSTAALTVLGPDHRFTTKVVYGHGTLTLVGGGDRVLSTAELTALAKTAVAGLKHAGVTSVKVHVDDSLFPKPTLATGWNSGYYDGSTVAPVRALVVDGHNVMDTSVDAGQVFARQLAAQGVTVTGGVAHGQATSSDVPVAVHNSPTLSAIVEQMLTTSDSNIGETLLRMTALGAGRQATFEDGTAVVRQVLSHVYGISLENFQIYDGSGLSRSDRVSAATLANILEVDSDPRYSRVLEPIIEGLPVAGDAGGTLSTALGRFTTPQSKCAVGKVMAKTGTLTGAIALSGLTKGEDGRWKIFSFVENGGTAATMDIRHAFDGLAATVNGCWA